MESEISNREGLSILKVGQSRMRAKYWRKTEKGWAQTQPLPADPNSINYYFAKGFRAKNPETNVKVDTVSTPKKTGCPFCDFETGNPRALRSHLNKHVNEEEK